MHMLHFKLATEKELSESCLVWLARLYWNSHNVNYMKKYSV